MWDAAFFFNPYPLSSTLPSSFSSLLRTVLTGSVPRNISRSSAVAGYDRSPRTPFPRGTSEVSFQIERWIVDLQDVDFSAEQAMLVSQPRLVDGHPARLTHPSRQTDDPSSPSRPSTAASNVRPTPPPHRALPSLPDSANVFPLYWFFRHPSLSFPGCHLLQPANHPPSPGAAESTRLLRPFLCPAAPFLRRPVRFPSPTRPPPAARQPPRAAFLRWPRRFFHVYATWRRGSTGGRREARRFFSRGHGYPLPRRRPARVTASTLGGYLPRGARHGRTGSREETRSRHLDASLTLRDATKNSSLKRFPSHRSDH